MVDRKPEEDSPCRAAFNGKIRRERAWQNAIGDGFEASSVSGDVSRDLNIVMDKHGRRVLRLKV